MLPSTFLKSLWGDIPPGLIQIWALQGRRSVYVRAPQAADVIATPGRPDVYTGVGLARRDMGRYRRAPFTEIVAVAGLWLDIDVNGGPDHKTGAAPTKQAAAVLARRHLEPTVIVDSGYGVHAWWLTEQPWVFTSVEERDRAQLAAAQWYELHRQAARGDGWSVDHTHDLTRLLRLPGTANGKGDPQMPVDILERGGHRYTREQLLDLAGTVGPLVLAGGVGETLPEIRPVDGSGLSRDRLALMFEASPEFADTFHHRRRVGDGSLSAYDMSLASQAATFMNDQEIAELIARHRLHHDPADAKHRRVKYLQTTIAKARQQSTRDSAQQQLRQLAARARTRTAA